MADNEEQLAIDIVAKLNNLEKQMARANQITARAYRDMSANSRRATKQMEDDAIRSALRINQAFATIDGKIGNYSKAFGVGIGGGVAAVGAALGVDKLRQMTDVWTDLKSRVDLASGSMEKGAEVMGRLGEMARRTYSDFTQTAESYLANSTAVKELGFNSETALDYVEAVNNALVISATKGDRAKSVMDALSKAMALGKLSGDELNTVLSSGGRVAEALAAGLGTTTNGLRKLGSEGKITGDAIVKALTSQMEVLRKEAEAMPGTISDGFTLLNNALLQYVGNADQATEVSAHVAQALTLIADNFDKVADAGLQVAAVIAGALIGRSITGMIRTLAVGTAEITKFTRAMVAMRESGTFASALGGIGAAAGPVGLVIGGAVVASLLLYNRTIGASSEASKTYEEALKRIQEQASDTADAVEQSGEKIARGLPDKLSDGVEEGQRRIADATQSIIDLFDNMLRSVDRSIIPPEEIKKVENLRDRFADGAITGKQLAAAMDDITRANPQWESFTKAIEGYVSKLMEAVGATRLMAAQLADLRTAAGRGAKDDALPIDVRGIQAENYEKEALRRAALGKNQLTLENEIGKVRNDALRDGIKLTEEQIKKIAEANIAGDAARSAEGKKPKSTKAKTHQKTTSQQIDDDIRAMSDRTTALQLETELVGKSVYEQEKRRASLDLEQAALAKLRDEAIKKGQTDLSSIKLSDEQKAKIDAVSDAYARQAQELQNVQVRQQEADPVSYTHLTLPTKRIV